MPTLKTTPECGAAGLDAALPAANGTTRTHDLGSGKRRRKAQSPRRELIRARKACRLYDVSEATWWRWDAAGKIPAGIKIGGVKRWRRAELEAHIRAGCPDRRTWQALQEGSQGNGRK
jgi:predicted DNA-binding transcriptional regulator AlpA